MTKSFISKGSNDECSLLDKYLVTRSHVVKSQLKSVLRDIFGYYALLYSDKARELSEGSIVIRKSVVISDRLSDCDIYCQYHELPIASDSIDLALLPEVIETADFPHRTLREVERVLIPEGQVVMLRRNPISWLNCQRIWAEIRRTKSIPSRSYGKARLNDWFSLLGLEITAEIPISLRYQTMTMKKNNGIGATWLKWFLKHFANYHIIVAKKKVSTLIPIRPSWRRNRKLVRPRFAEPTVNNKLDDVINRLQE